jgi:FMN-dependent NADH-azoreductase
MPGFERIAERKVLSEYEDFQEWYAEKRRADGFVEDDLRNAPVPELLQAMLEWMAAGRPRL